MNLQLSAHGMLLLPNQLRLDGTFQHRLIRRDMALPCAALETAELTVSQEPKTINLTLRHGPTCHSRIIARTDMLTVLITAEMWIDAALNGRLEAAA